MRSQDEKTNHPSLKRLLGAAAERGVNGPTALADLLGESAQTVTNWGSRGVSKSGALKAQEKLGVSATWVRQATGSTWAADASNPDRTAAQVLAIRSPRPGDVLITELGAALSTMSGLKRDMARAILLRLVDEKDPVAECAAEFAQLLGGADDQVEPIRAAGGAGR